jgi:hypothetical protein
VLGPRQSALLRVQLAIGELEAAELALQRELEADQRPQLRVIDGGDDCGGDAAIPPARAGTGT